MLWTELKLRMKEAKREFCFPPRRFASPLTNEWGRLEILTAHHYPSYINSIKHFGVAEPSINYMTRKIAQLLRFRSDLVAGQLRPLCTQHARCWSKACRIVIG